MTWRQRRAGVYRGWILLEEEEYVDGRWVMYYSAKGSGELRERFMRPAYWPSAPRFESMDGVTAWIDENAPYKLS